MIFPFVKQEFANKMRIVNNNLYSTKALGGDVISIDKTRGHIRILQSNGIYLLIPVFILFFRS